MDFFKDEFMSISDMELECNNLTHLTKLVVKDILRMAVKFNQQLDEDHPLILQLLRVLEAVTKHGLKPKKILNSVSITGFSGIDPWPVICDVFKGSPATDIIDSVQQMGLKSGLGRFRAWLKLALMQKNLGDYYRFITEQTRKLEQYYYPSAIILGEKAVEISGTLVGLSVVECNFIKFKETMAEIDLYTGVLNYSRYMSKDLEEWVCVREEDDDEGVSDAACGDLDAEGRSLRDQKSYTEELNAVLQSRLDAANVQVRRLEAAAQNESKMAAELTSRNQALAAELDRARGELAVLGERYDHRSRLMQDDLEVERNTYQTSRHELYQMNVEMERRLREEINARLDSEKVLTSAVTGKSDLELVTATLERQLQEKQQSIAGVRRQLDQVKAVNLELSADSKEKQTAFDHKAGLVEKLEQKTNGMALIIDQMDVRIKKLTGERAIVEKEAEQMRQRYRNIENLLKEKIDEMEVLQTKLSTMGAEIEVLKKDKKQLLDEKDMLLKKIDFLELDGRQAKARCQEQTEALEDMARLVEHSKLESEGLREMQVTITEAKWTDDKDVNDCVQCCKPFNVSRRKHHCRRCGGVFCHDCSSNRMPLASSARPMRVCDTCLNTLMKTYTASMASRISEDD